ncbi:MAG: MFS transporter [Clostridia bacterium]
MENIVKTQNWKKTFFIIWLGQAFSFLGSSIVSFAIIWWITEKTGSATILLVATLMSFMPQGILGPFIGVIVDRYSRKKIMILSDLSIAVATSFLVIAGILGDIPIWIIMIVMFVRSIGSAFHSPSLSSSIPLLVPKEYLTKASGWNQMLVAGSQVIGPIIGAAFLAFMDIGYIALIDIIGAIFAILSLLCIKLPELNKSEIKKVHVLKDMKEGFLALKNCKGIFKLSIIIAIMEIVIIPLGTLFPLMTKNHFNGTAINASIIETVFGIGMTLGAVMLGIFGCKKKKVIAIIISIITVGITVMISGLLPSSAFVIFAVLSIIMGAAGSFCSGLYTALLQEKIDVNVLRKSFFNYKCNASYGISTWNDYSCPYL